MGIMSKFLNMLKLSSEDECLEQSDYNVHIFSPEEEKRWEKYRHEKELRKIQCNSFKIEDMYQFTEIPFEWQWVTELNHTNG